MLAVVIRCLCAVSICSLVLAATPVAHAASFNLTKGTPTGMSGVSPFATPVDTTTDLVFHSAGEAGGWLMSTCATGSQCTSLSLPREFGTDYTQVTLMDGTKRAYFVIVDADGTKEIATAPVTFTNGVPTLGTTSRLGIQASAGQRAWGVPDSIVTPEGLVRLYWVDNPGEESGNFQPTGAQRKCLATALGRKGAEQLASGKKLSPAKAKKAAKAAKKCKIPASALGARGSRSTESIVSATSTDSSGTSFVPDAGYRITGGYVDSDVIQAKGGDWLMLLSTGPGEPPQRLFIATSRDGLAWKVNRKPLTPSSFNALDPVAVQTGPKQWRVYYAKSPKKTPFANHQIVMSTLTR